MHVSQGREGDGFFALRVLRIVPLYWAETVIFYFWTHLGLANTPSAFAILWERLLNRPEALWGWVRDNHGLKRRR